MQTKDWFSVLTAGFLAAGLFLFIAVSGLGFFFLFLPVLPLLWPGLGREPKLALYSALAAAFIVAVADPGAGLSFLLLLGLPAWALARLALLWRQGENGVAWFPLGLALTRLTLYACSLVALIGLAYASQEGGIAKAVSGQMRAALDHLGEDYAQAAGVLAEHWAFLAFSTGIWLWGVMLYAYGWLANTLLRRMGRNIRPDFAIQPFPMPNWMLALLALCALASFAGAASLAFIGKALLIALLLPYFFLGAAWMHEVSRDWPNRRFFLFFIYLLIVAQFWPALILSVFGLVYHIKRLSGAGNSTK